MKKRILSMLLVLVLLVALVPLHADAAVTIYWPVPGHTHLSQGYHANNAIDISDGSINGATVIAAASGTVTHIYLCSNTHNDSYSIQHPESTDCNGFGTGLVIKADDGRIYQYAHMQGGSIPSNVYRGAYVSAGQMIGRVGATGCATGPHLHFGISTTPNKYWEYGPNPDPAAGNYTYIYDGSCLQHTYGDWTYTKYPTCTETGTQVRSCTKCGHTETRSIAPTLHSYGDWVVTKSATCTEDGVETRTCPKCNGVETRSIPKSGHTYGDWTVVQEASCTAQGSKTRTCSTCGNVDTAVIEMAAHKYVSETIPATCSAPGGTKYTCSVCGKTYTETATVGWSDWSETKPAGVEDSLIESKTQYRSSKYETKTSYNTSESDWTRKSSDWEKANSGSVTYVKSWPGGFHTGNALYGTYNKTPVSASETATAKTVVNSESISGYIYWHWCRGSYTAGPINRRVSDVCEGEFQTFHAFYSTSNASSTDANDTNGGDCKYYPNGGCCTDTYWYFQIPVYTQNYTNYKKLFTYERWTDWSDWGDKEISASDTRKVETRTVYRYYTAAKEHTWDAGTVTAAATCTADGAKTYTCSVCQTTKTEPIAKLGHDYRQTVVAATCTAKGYTLNKCSRCGDEYRDAETAMLPHKYVDGVCTACGDKVTMFTLGAVTAKAGDTVTVPVEIKNNTGFAGFTLKITADANLTLTGIAKGELMEKANSGLFVDNVKGGVINWTSDRNITGDGVLLKLTFTVADNAPDGKYEISVALKDDEASNCVDENGRALRAAFEAGSVLVSAAPHMHDYAVTVTAPTCTAKGYTTHTCACGDSYVDTYVDALGHAWDNGKVTKPATETEDGVKTFTCTRCGETKTETIPATGVMDVTKMFTDVSHSWADDGIQYCVTHQLMSGIGNDLFGPKLTTTRAQIVQILYNLEGEPEVSGTTPFTDLTQDWYQDAVLWAYQTGVVAGTSSTTFEPDRPVTREQIAVILMEYVTRVLKLERTWTPADLSAFPDAGSVSDWAKDAMADAVALGLISGASNGGQTLLEPQGSATREQVATILMEFCKNVIWWKQEVPGRILPLSLPRSGLPETQSPGLQSHMPHRSPFSGKPGPSVVPLRLSH